jgi:hypothetical protein
MHVGGGRGLLAASPVMELRLISSSTRELIPDHVLGKGPFRLFPHRYSSFSFFRVDQEGGRGPLRPAFQR